LKKTLTFMVLAVFVIFGFNGCASKAVKERKKAESRYHEEISSKIFLPTNKKINELKIYIDNSLDEKRNTEIMQRIHAAIVEKGNVTINIFETNATYRVNSEKVKNYAIKLAKNKYLTEYTANNEVKFYSKYRNFSQKTIDISNATLEGNKIIIDGIQSEEEAIKTYIQIVLGVAGLHQKDKYSVNTAKEYGVGFPLSIEGIIQDNGKLTMSGEIMNAVSLKKQLTRHMRLAGYQLVDSKDEADFIFNVENLGYGAPSHIGRYLKVPVVNTRRGDVVQSATGLGNSIQAFGGNSGVAAGVSLAFALLDAGAVEPDRIFHHLTIYNSNEELIASTTVGRTIGERLCYYHGIIMMPSRKLHNIEHGYNISQTSKGRYKANDMIAGYLVHKRLKLRPQ